MAAPWAHGVELTVKGRIHGSETNNVFHLATNSQAFDNPNALNLALIALATAMLQCFTEFFLAFVSSDWSGTSVTVRPIHPQLGDEVEVAFPADSVGETQPTNVSFASALVNIKTGGGGRRGRGKKFFAPPGDDRITSSEIDGPTLVLLGQFLACVAGKFMQPSPSTDWRLGVFSPTQSAAAVGGGFDNAFREAVSMVPSKVVAKLGSRKLGSGN